MSNTVGYCYLFGYGRDPRDVRLIYGVPDWVLYGVVAPWTACTLFAWWYTFGLVSDDDLGSKLAFKLRNAQVRYFAIQPQREEAIERIELVKGPDHTAPVVVAVTVEGR
jgi:hypothetical protein